MQMGGGTEGNQTTPENTVSIDVSGENTETADYKITDTSINLSKRDVQYELTGTTNKKIYVWGSNNAEDIDQAFYIRLNNVAVNGGIVAQNSPVKMVIDVPAGTVNTISSVTPNDLTIKGSGTLNASYLGSTQKTSYMPSALSITDTKINVKCEPNRSCALNGSCVLSGDADVKYIGGGTYAPLQVGVKDGDNTHSLTLKDNAKLYCLQDNAEEASAYAVNGLEIFNGAKLKLEDSSYLEAEGKASSGAYVGSAIMSSSEIRVKDNATIKATAYGSALATWGDVIVEGGNVIVDSKNSNGIYAAGDINISNGADIEAKGDAPALYGGKALTIAESKVKASSNESTYGIYAIDGVSVSDSWIETSGPEDFGKNINNSVLFNGTTGKVIGNHSINKDVTVSDGMILDIPEGTSITVPEGKTLTNNGIIEENGTFERTGTIVNNGIIIKPAKIFNFGEAKSGYSAVDPQVLLEKGDGGYDVSITDNDYELVTDSGNVTIGPKAGLAAGEYNKNLEIKITKNGTDVKTFERGVNFKVTAASSGGSYNPVQKPEIITGEGGKTSLENNGTTLVITPDDGMQISKVTVNGNEVTVIDNKVTGLKTGDKVEVTFTKIPPTKEEIDKAFKEKLLNLGLTVRTSKTAKKNVKAVVKETSELKDLIKEIKDAGYTVKYKFYRSTKKSSKYEERITKTEGRYINTIGKKGTKYYYKAKLLIYDTEGNLVAQTELKQCKYGLRTWSK